MRNEERAYFSANGENDACHDRVGKTSECDARGGVFENDRIAFLRKRTVETALGKKLRLWVWENDCMYTNQLGIERR